MAGISQYLKKIKEAVYGREVRGAIHDAINQAYVDANDVVKVSETQPTEENVKIWVKPESDEMKVPTWEEFEEVASTANAADAALAQSNCAYVFCESGTYRDGDGVTKRTEGMAHRIRNAAPIPVAPYNGLTIPAGYQAYPFYLDEAKTLITSPGWVTGGEIEFSILPDGVKYINLGIGKTGAMNDDISADVDTVASGLILWAKVDAASANIKSIDERLNETDTAFQTFRERTDNLFELEQFGEFGWGLAGDEVSGKISALKSAKFMDGYNFEPTTVYTLTLYAFTEGNSDSSSNNGLRVRFYYTDGSYTGISVRNNALTKQYLALMSDGAKTVDYLEFYYSNNGDNIWHIADVMLTHSSDAVQYSKYKTAIDTTARNKLQSIPTGSLLSSPSAINQSVWESLTPSAVSANWVLDGLGTSAQDAAGRILKFNVTAGTKLWINTDGLFAGGFQFQNQASVGRTGGSNPYLVNAPINGPYNDVVTVPSGATYLLISDSQTAPFVSVKAMVYDGAKSGVLPGYWAQYISDKAIEISQETTLASSDSTPTMNGTRFIFITDTHLRGGDGKQHNAGWSPLLMKYLKEHCNIGLAFFGGDSITGSYASQADAIKDLVLFRDTFSPVWDWMHSIYGNHEYGNNSSSLSPLSPAVLYNLLIQDKEGQYSAIQRNYGSYSFDNAGQKIRFICMSCNYGNNYTQQSSFLCDLLKSTPAGWTIVILSHFSLQKSSGTVEIHSKLTATNSIVPAVEAYMGRLSSYNGYNFSDAGATVACILGGHTHWDGIVKTASGVPVIATTCDKWYSTDDVVEHVKGTTTEQAFEVVTINTSTKKIHLNRIGCGESREISYAS